MQTLSRAPPVASSSAVVSTTSSSSRRCHHRQHRHHRNNITVSRASLLSSSSSSSRRRRLRVGRESSSDKNNKSKTFSPSATPFDGEGRSFEDEDANEEMNNDDPDEYSLEDDEGDDLGSSEEEELEKFLRDVADREIMLKKLTNDMVQKFVTTGTGGGDGERTTTNDDADEETTSNTIEDAQMGDETSGERVNEDGSIVFDSIDEEKRDEMLKDIWLPKRASMRGSVQLFLDSADESEWRKWLPTGLFSGVTTSMQLLEKSETLATANDEDFSFQTLLDLVDAALEYESVKEVHVPSWGLDSDEIWKNGIVLAKNDPQRIVVAVPCSYEGVKAANALVADGARVQISGVFAPHQALMAAAIGASYVAPTFGKMYDAGRDGFKATEEMMKTITKCGSESKVLVKNVRSAADLANLGSIGCDTFAISADVCEDMFSDSLTAQYNKELNVTVARIGEKQRELKLEAKKQKLAEMEKQSMPVQDDPESEGDADVATTIIATQQTTTAAGASSSAGENNIVSLEEMPKEVFVENDSSDAGGDASSGSVDSGDVIDSDDFTRKDFDP
jgi:transaldolase